VQDFDEDVRPAKKGRAAAGSPTFLAPTAQGNLGFQPGNCDRFKDAPAALLAFTLTIVRTVLAVRLLLI
jgi:hypothetical protein